MNLLGRLVTAAIKGLVDSRCRIDSSELEKIPFKGPFIIIMNHTNFLEVPIVYTHLLPRPVVGVAKAESWKIPLYGFLARQWEGIPIKRGTVDMNAFRKMAEALKKGKILILAPEGTRNVTGVLKRAYPGIVTIALENNVPIIPVAHYGGEKFWFNLKRLRRTDFKFCVGRPFYINPGTTKITGKLRKDLVYTVMTQLAKILPLEYRGVYSDAAEANEDYLEFLDERTYSQDSEGPSWLN